MLTAARKILPLLLPVDIPEISYIGSVTKGVSHEAGWGPTAMDVLSVADTGDLVVIAFSFDSDPDNVWSWGGMSFTEILNRTGHNNPGMYVGYRFIEAGDNNPYLVDVHTNTGFSGLSAVAAVFRGVNSYVGYDYAIGSSGKPDPPELVASGKLWIATGHLDDDPVTLTAPPGYTLSASKYQSGAKDSTTAVAYKIASLSSDNPGEFGGGGNDENIGVTIAFE